MNYNIWLVGLAALVCASGSTATVGLFTRALTTSAPQTFGWQFLTAITAGASIWCTHFVAMLAYEPSAPVSFDPVLTIVSVLVAAAGSALGFLVAASRVTRAAPLVGGAIVGLAIAAMHYCGMLAYRVEGLVTWRMSYLAASVALAAAFCAASLHFAVRRRSGSDRWVATGLLVVATLALHFTGMAAFRVAPMLVDHGYSNPDALRALALAVAGVGLLIVGTGFVSFLIDDDVRAKSYRELRHLALNDSLTQMPNRTAFSDRLDRQIERADRTSTGIALVTFDLDRFKEINDQSGHSVGDEVLKAVAQRIQSLLRPEEFVARIGGDEFAGVHMTRTGADLTEFLGRLSKAFSKSIRVNASDFAIGASFGVALYPDDACDKDSLIRNAYLAMYRAKSERSVRACFFDPSMDERVRRRRRLASDLRGAIANHELQIYYQLQSSVETGEVTGYEALLRWKHPRDGFISPAEFIPLAEENGLIERIGEWVLRNACAQTASWEPACKIAVNLSAIQLAQPHLPSLVRDVLLETDFPAARLELELTESAIMRDKVVALHMLRQIKALGVTIALDDFGTGYSSLDVLRSFPFDKIKLDRSFISDIETNREAKAILRAVLAMGKSLDIPVLAEGVETDGQLATLRAKGCSEVQGFLLGRPAPADQLIAAGKIRLAPQQPPETPRARPRQGRPSVEITALSA